jgi:hypothetical protein
MGSDWPNNNDAVMRGLFGSLQAGAANGRDAANMWQSLREGAYALAQDYLQKTGIVDPTEEQIQARGQELIGHVTIMDMNRYVKEVGNWMSAKSSLANLESNQQITGASIWTPSWNKTADNPAIPTRYKLRVLRDITYRGINVNEQRWSTYEITSPLTTIEDALGQADSLFGQARYFRSATINSILDYEIVAI